MIHNNIPNMNKHIELTEIAKNSKFKGKCPKGKGAHVDLN